MQNLPPRPWSYETNAPADSPGKGFVYIVDANGRKIGSIWGTGAEKIAIAEMIVSRANALDAEPSATA